MAFSRHQQNRDHLETNPTAPKEGGTNKKQYKQEAVLIVSKLQQLQEGFDKVKEGTKTITCY